MVKGVITSQEDMLLVLGLQHCKQAAVLSGLTNAQSSVLSQNLVLTTK